MHSLCNFIKHKNFDVRIYISSSKSDTLIQCDAIITQPVSSQILKIDTPWRQRMPVKATYNGTWLYILWHSKSFIYLFIIML